MNTQEARILIFIGLMIAIGPAYAAQSPDQPSASSSTPATTAPAPATTATPATAAAAPSSTSVEVMKRARLAGYHIKKLGDGTPVFCKKEAPIGSRFSTESCISEPQLQEFLIRAQDQRDKLHNRRGTGTDYQ